MSEPNKQLPVWLVLIIVGGVVYVALSFLACGLVKMNESMPP